MKSSSGWEGGGQSSSIGYRVLRSSTARRARPIRSPRSHGFCVISVSTYATLSGFFSPFCSAYESACSLLFSSSNFCFSSSCFSLNSSASRSPEVRMELFSVVSSSSSSSSCISKREGIDPLFPLCMATFSHSHLRTRLPPFRGDSSVQPLCPTCFFLTSLSSTLHYMSLAAIAPVVHASCNLDQAGVESCRKWVLKGKGRRGGKTRRWQRAQPSTGTVKQREERRTDRGD
mmetsp:Transcript_4965/g.10661  ORF Transcript_4965/g.10661 Transcript_4965/m.10661 type:complete len:231 (-) Transcript_4965:28-720(-)